MTLLGEGARSQKTTSQLTGTGMLLAWGRHIPKRPLLPSQGQFLG